MHIRGVDKLSKTKIDADKDWEGCGQTNLDQLAESMQKGDLLIRGDENLVILQPGPIGTQLTARDPGNLPVFQYPP